MLNPFKVFGQPVCHVKIEMIQSHKSCECLTTQEMVGALLAKHISFAHMLCQQACNRLLGPAAVTETETAYLLSQDWSI